MAHIGQKIRFGAIGEVGFIRHVLSPDPLTLNDLK